jgi:hypothetical protein
MGELKHGPGARQAVAKVALEAAREENDLTPVAQRTIHVAATNVVYITPEFAAKVGRCVQLLSAVTPNRGQRLPSSAP